MGAGRKTTTIQVNENYDDSWKVSNSAPARNLSKVELGAIIFGCKHSTIKECLEEELFGLPAPHYSYVRKVTPGLPLFLFNYSDRKLHGIFEAVSSGQMNINPNAWITSSEVAATSPYPAQVRIRAKCRCRPVLEEEMRPIIASNYYTEKLFWFELDKEQTKRLMILFKPSPSTENILRPSNAEWKENISDVPSRPSVINFKECFGVAEARLKENKHSNTLVNNRDAFPTGKKWSELFKPSSSSSAVNNAEVSTPQKVLNPSTSLCLDLEWESAPNYNTWGELPPEDCHGAANAESDSSVVECWEDSDLVDSYLNEISENCVRFQDGDSGSHKASSEKMTLFDGWGDPVQAQEFEEALVDGKGNNGSNITKLMEEIKEPKVSQFNHSLDSSKGNDGSSIAMIMEEIEGLKVCQFNQSLKIQTLEQELVNSKQEIDELKKRCQKLQSLPSSLD